MGLLVAILLVALPLAALSLRPGAPVERLAQILREGGIRLMAIVVVFCVAMASFTTFKIGIPKRPRGPPDKSAWPLAQGDGSMRSGGGN